MADPLDTSSTDPRERTQAAELSRAGDHGGAAAHWAKAAQLNPTRGQTWVELGRAHYAAGQYQQAVPAFERATELGGGFPEAGDTDYSFRWQCAYDLARCHARLQDPAAALGWLERALRLGYRHRSAIREDATFAALRDDEWFRQLAGLVDVAGLGRDGGWRHDLSLLAEEVRRLHYQPFRTVSEEDFWAAVHALHGEIPRLSEPQIVVRLMGLLRLVGDGHTRLTVRTRSDFPDVPLELYLFTEGLYVTAVAPTFADLLGAQVVGFADRPLSEALAAVETLISRDNPMGVLEQSPGLLRKPQVLRAMGIIDNPAVLPIRILDDSGTERTVTVPVGAEQLSEDEPEGWLRAAGTLGGDPASGLPWYLQQPTSSYCFSQLPDFPAVYVQYRQVQDDEREPFAEFCHRLFSYLDEHDTQSLVLDIRNNSGGNTFLHAPLFQGLRVRLGVHTLRRLFVIIGRRTFSAAMNAASYLDHRRWDWAAEVIFAGEPTGSSPNFVGETVITTLPFSGLRLSISDLSWQGSWPMDQRIWIAPDLYAPPTFAAYRAGRDPALEAVQRHLAGDLDRG